MDVMTVREVADALRCSQPLVYKLIRQGSLRALRVSESPRPALRVRRDDLTGFLSRVNPVEK